MNTKRPNVVICLCDQLRPFEVGCYGGETVHTPNIDTLAAGGVRFQTACSNNPVCTPARSAILSGQYTRTCIGTAINAHDPSPTRDKMPDPTIAEMFRDSGYKTGLIGKWHLYTDPEVLGFDTAIYPYYAHKNTDQTYFSNGGASAVVEGFGQDHEMKAVRQWISTHRGDPFFLYYNISQPHMPLADAPERYKTMYDPEAMSLRENVRTDGKLSWNEQWFKIYLWDHLFYLHHLPHTEHLPEGFDLKQLTALYCGLVTWADDQLGELMRTLDENGLADDTIVLFTSDHGDLLGSHDMYNKDVLYEESVRVPMVFRWPSRLAPRMVDTQVASLVDVMPTLLSLAGIDVPDHVQGTDLSPVVSGESETTGENAAFIETSCSQIGLRTLTHKLGYVKDKDSGQISDPIFYDLVTDPMEQHNLEGTPQQPETHDNLLKRLEQWDAATPWMR